MSPSGDPGKFELKSLRHEITALREQASVLKKPR